MQEMICNNAIGFLVGLLSGVGIPAIAGFLRQDAKKKLADEDKSNDFVAKLEEVIADALEKNKDVIVHRAVDVAEQAKNTINKSIKKK